MTKVTYRLSRRPSGFDFFPWLVVQKALGATHVEFDIRDPKTDKWPLDCVMRRYESILKPGPALLGMTSSEGKGEFEFSSGSQQDLVARCRNGLKIPRLKSVLPAGKERYTVTLRKTQRVPSRNSREGDWRAFAAEIGALVIPDYDDVPIHLHERMALYAGAEMNFCVTNGPVMLGFLSEYPMWGFDVQNSPMVKMGIPLGKPYPFLLAQHKQIYEPDTLPVIRRHFDAWLKARQR